MFLFLGHGLEGARTGFSGKSDRVFLCAFYCRIPSLPLSNQISSLRDRRPSPPSRYFRETFPCFHIRFQPPSHPYRLHPKWKKPPPLHRSLGGNHGQMPIWLKSQAFSHTTLIRRPLPSDWESLCRTHSPLPSSPSKKNTTTPNTKHAEYEAFNLKQKCLWSISDHTFPANL